MIVQPFMPTYGSNQVVTAAGTSASVPINASNKQVRVVNNGSNIGYFKTYSSVMGPLTASTADCPVPPSMATTVTKDESHDRIAYISSGGTTLQIMTGEGF